MRFVGAHRNAAAILDLRNDADYALPSGGYGPVKVTYCWQENGEPKELAHVANSPHETHQIVCLDKPTMKSIVLELVE